ncbi:bZIP transcription factor [Halosimplex litoreum]|uniref:BZIP transcription factor n=1 Tax=Halosimplex litoreum TaxID=1198301 RepID=A0A7T3G0F6_9EURY|nr:bZIP transcription factor [Halosimplex litoreum]QPV64021.1 bZIP transcription factor [Halosimplex litoreum]
MCGNRVEELESRVKELEASVEGLTDELVECKVRLRELENAVDEDIGFTPDEPAESSESPDEAEADRTNTEDNDEADSTESGPGDIIIA